MGEEDAYDDAQSSSAFSSYDPYDDYDANAAALLVQYEMDTDLPIDDSVSKLDIYDSQPLVIPSYDIEEEFQDGFYGTETTSDPVVLDDNSPILRGLNSNQVEAVTKPNYCITRVIAGPGSGKTRVLTNRIAYLLQQNSRDRILAVTFTRKASNEMQERLHKLIEEQENFAPSKRQSYINEEAIDSDGTEMATKEAIRRVMLGTFHSVCTKILRWNGEYLSSLPSIKDDMSKSPNPNNIVLDGNFHISDPRENVRTLKETLEEYNINIHEEKNIKIDDIMKLISFCKAKLFEGENPFLNDNGFVTKPMEITTKIYYRFREKFLSTNSLDFDDLIYLTRELLTNHPDIRARLQQRWQHIFVDEYQDTSVVQADLIKLLTTNSLFVVGDADQSIYAWRGAYVESLYDFADEFKEFSPEGVATVYLMENYRYGLFVL
jgi:DNA helicase-2/ATP-dependent DNA helicase PcrA